MLLGYFGAWGDTGWEHHVSSRGRDSRMGESWGNEGLYYLHLVLCSVELGVLLLSVQTEYLHNRQSALRKARDSGIGESRATRGFHLQST